MSEIAGTALFLVLSAVVYLTGYSYLTGYYQLYDIEVRELGFSIEDILAHALPPAKETLREFWELGLASFIASSAMLAANRIRPVAKVAIAASLIAAFAMVVQMLVLSRSLGSSVAASELRSLDLMYFSEESTDAIMSYFKEERPDKIAHLATTSNGYILIGTYNGSDEKWIIRTTKDGRDAAFVYMDRSSLR